MLTSLTDKQLRLTFYVTWLALLLLQCALVGLSGDEAYYWKYSRELAWGYFDHPPLTAALVKMGYFIFPNELGVRLFFALIATGLIYSIERLIQPANLRLFYSIMLSVAFLHIGLVWGGGMMALPDFPLLLSEALFFIAYKEYLDRPRLVVYVLLPLVTALMLLSKYHGILVAGFVVLSNPRLLLKPAVWIMGLATALLLTPHIMWQVTHDFPSIRFHLLERSSNPYTINYTLEYLGAQPFALGPLISLVLIYCAFRFRPQNTFDRAMKFTALGTYAFFLFMTFKGRVEGNWTFIALVPLVFMGYKYIESNAMLLKITRYCFIISIVSIVAVRVVITARIPVGKFKEPLTPWMWTEKLNTATGGRPAAFINSYQKAALYEFYEGIPSFSLNNFWGRKNQYTTWDSEAAFQGKDVAVILNWERPDMDSIRIDGEYFPFTTINNFRSTSNLVITSNLDAPIRARASSVLQANIVVAFGNERRGDLDASKNFTTGIVYAFFQGIEPLEITDTGLVVGNDAIGKTKLVDVKMPAKPGQYTLCFAAVTGWLPAGINSQRWEVIVEP